MTIPPDDDPNALSARIAAAYDLVPYDPQVQGYPGLDPAPVFGIAGLYGELPPLPAIDILDLGCGAGAQMERVAAQTPGRIVGVDLSRASCDTARARGAKFGNRFAVHCADLAAMDAARLGAFDLVYLVGVLYVAPLEIQPRLYDLVAACLKPGGVAVVSYYSPGLAAAIVRLRRMLRAETDPALPPPARTAAARAQLTAIAGRTPPRDRDEAVIRQHLQTCGDAGFFHEMLNESFEVIASSAIAAALGARGVRFLNWMPPAPFDDLRAGDPTAPPMRAALADRFDATAPGYRYAVFRKGGSASPALPRPLRWQTRLQRRGTSADTGPAAFRDPAFGVDIKVTNLPTVIALDRLGAGALDEPALFQAVERDLAKRGIAAGQIPHIIGQDFFGLWQNGLLAASWNPDALK